MTVRYYSSSAGKMVLQLGVTAVATAIQVDTTAGLPGTTPFTLLLDVGLPNEEIVTVTQVSGNTLVVTRGEDGTAAQAHANGAVVRHAISARDLRDSRDHENSTSAHGTTSAVVGVSDAQALTNKNLSSGTNTFPSSLATDAELSAHTTATAAHGATGAVVGTTNVQTLTGKTLQASLQIPASAASVASTVQGAASQAADLQRWQDSTGVNLARVNANGTISNHTGSVGAILYSGSDTPPGTYQAYVGNGDVAKNTLSLAAPAGQTADILRASVNGVTVASIQADGDVTGANIPASGIAGTSTGKASKRLHWGTFSSVTDSSGNLTVTHGAGFTPTVVLVTPGTALQHSVDTIGATTFRYHIVASDGSAISSPVSVSGFYICGE